MIHICDEKLKYKERNYNLCTNNTLTSTDNKFSLDRTDIRYLQVLDKSSDYLC